MATKSYFSGIFGSSPVKPLQEHMTKVVDCVELVSPFFHAVIGEDFDEVARLQGEIGRLENEADDLKKSLRLHLPNSLFMPVDRRDLLELLRAQDNIANNAKDIAGLVLGRQMRIPTPLKLDFQEFVDIGVEASRRALKTVNEFDELVETGFRGSEVELVQGLLEQLDAKESESDELQIRLRAKLRTLEQELPPVDVMFLYRIIENVGKLADLAQRVGSRLQLMLAK